MLVDSRLSGYVNKCMPVYMQLTAYWLTSLLLYKTMYIDVVLHS
jgi:hypothetical protein